MKETISIPRAIIKYGEKQYMEKLLNEGELFLRPLKYYRTIEDEHKRDPFEGASRTFINWIPYIGDDQYKFSPFIDEKAYKITESFGALFLDNHNQYIYCMYGCWVDNFQPCSDGLCGLQIDPKMEKYGDSMVVISDIPEFLKRLDAKCTETGRSFYCKRVTYTDFHEKDRTNLTPFDKDVRFSHEQEWRIMLDVPVDSESFKLHLGPLNDIARIFYTNPDKRTFFHIPTSGIAQEII